MLDTRIGSRFAVTLKILLEHQPFLGGYLTADARHSFVLPKNHSINSIVVTLVDEL
jgi:hypothetical protein